MQHLSRRFSGFVFLYAVIAWLLVQGVSILYMLFPDFFNIQVSSEVVVAIPIRLLSYFVIFLPPLIFIGARRYPFLKLLRVNTFSFKSFWFTLGISLCLYLFVRMLNLLISGVISTAFNPEFPVNYFSSNIQTLWPFVITTCLIPAFFQVMAFQGAIQSGFHDLKPLRSCLYTGILFALYMLISSLGFFSFFNLINLIPLFLIGFAISYVSIKAGSIIPGMITAFLCYFLSRTDIEDRFYINCLMPLGISENLAVFVLALLSIIIGGILLVKMPQASNSRTLRIPSIKKFIKILLQSRERFQRSWLPAEEDNTPEPFAEEQIPEISESDERLVYPDDSEKQKKGIGFKIGIILIIIAVLSDLGISIYLLSTGF